MGDYINRNRNPGKYNNRDPYGCMITLSFITGSLVGMSLESLVEGNFGDSFLIGTVAATLTYMTYLVYCISKQ